MRVKMILPAAQLWRFVWLEAKSCAFAIVLFCGIAASTIMRLPMHRYDLLLAYAIAVTLLFRVLGLETTAEIGVIAAFHAIGLLFELVKVRQGSWTYPEHAYTKVWGVPLYSGFLYAAVGSYVCRAWRLFHLRLSRCRSVPMAVAAVAIYANFVAEHWIPDLRYALALGLLGATWGTSVHFTVGPRRYRMPLILALVLIGFFLWVAENMATYLGAWRYPYQAGGWRLVHPSTFVSWSLLVTVTFVIVGAWQHRHARLHVGPQGGRPVKSRGGRARGVPRGGRGWSAAASGAAPRR